MLGITLYAYAVSTLAIIDAHA